MDPVPVAGTPLVLNPLIRQYTDYSPDALVIGEVEMAHLDGPAAETTTAAPIESCGLTAAQQRQFKSNVYCRASTAQIAMKMAPAATGARNSMRSAFTGHTANARMLPVRIKDATQRNTVATRH